MRLINANTLKGEFTGNFMDAYPTALVHALIDAQPTIDAVPVVRCKDCIFCYKYPNPAMYCRKHNIETDSDFYCEDGMEGDEE